MTKNQPSVPPQEPYGSIGNLPRVKEMRQQFRAFSLLGVLLPKGQRQDSEHYCGEVARRAVSKLSVMTWRLLRHAPCQSRIPI